VTANINFVLNEISSAHPGVLPDQMSATVIPKWSFHSLLIIFFAVFRSDG